MITIQEQLAAYILPLMAFHPIIAPQGSKLPYVTYQCVASPIYNVLSGPPPIANTRMQIDVWASSYGEAQSLAKELTIAMQSWPVQNVLLNSYDMYEEEVKVFRVLLEFSIWQ